MQLLLIFQCACIYPRDSAVSQVIDLPIYAYIYAHKFIAIEKWTMRVCGVLHYYHVKLPRATEVAGKNRVVSS